MNLRRLARSVVLLLLAASVSACCFHGHYGGWRHCKVPVRHCR